MLNTQPHRRNGNHGSTISHSWKTNPRWNGIERPYSTDDVARLQGSILIESTLARLGAERLWDLLHREGHVPALGAMTGNQAVQQVQAGLKAIYVSGWQVAADANSAGQMYPDQSLYPANSVPMLDRAINNALMRADQIHHSMGHNGTYWFAPIVADAEAGFGGPLNAYELAKAMIEAGAAAVHFEDQLPSAKKCGHMGGKVVVPIREFVEKLVAARLAADVMGVSTLIIARTDSNGARLLTGDIDPRDHPFISPERTPEGYFQFRGGIEAAITRGLAYAPYADMLWCETSEPNLQEAEHFAKAIHAKFPGKLLAYNCSPSFHWKQKLDDTSIANFQEKLAALGYKFQFVTLAGFHALNLSMFELAREYAWTGMSAYVQLQEAEFLRAKECGYSAVRHQQFVGTGYFDQVAQIVAHGNASTTALKGSTEEEQFGEEPQSREIRTRESAIPQAESFGYKETMEQLLK
ncbi:MAG: isocitrate lyase [Acidobacteria bacterium]|nr:isocitrate lyase [Acidobacteriota bacterium]